MRFQRQLTPSVLLAWCKIRGTQAAFLMLLISLLGVDLAAQTIPDQSFLIQEASFYIHLPADWIQAPERFMDRVRAEAAQLSNKIKVNYVCGFAGPRPPVNTPMTVILVQVFPRGLTPESILASFPEQKEEVNKARPGLELVMNKPYVAKELSAVVVPGQTKNALHGRTYILPTSNAVLSLGLLCPPEGAEATFKRIEKCFLKNSFTNGATIDVEWLKKMELLLKGKQGG